MTRTAIVLPLLLLGACNVEKTENGTTSVEFNQDAALNGAQDIANTAQNIGGEIVNDVKEEGGKVQNEVGDVNVDVDANVSRNTQ